jgi:cysteine-rich repeat protein
MRENAAFWMVLLAISAAHAMSDFWTQAKNTTNLSSLRIGTKATQPSVTKNDLVNNPLFMPLCGNGRIDRKEDYIAYGATLTVSRARLLSEQAGEDDGVYNVSIIADEECDDGNRLDFDGCSADCMYTDCMTSACDLAVDVSLEYEDLIYDDVRGKMVVSALNGIYSLEIGPNETTMRAVIIAAKNFKAVSLFRHNRYLVLYDPAAQSLWGVADGSNELTRLNKLDMLVGWNPSYGKWSAIVSHPNGPIVIRDGNLPQVAHRGSDCE